MTPRILRILTALHAGLLERGSEAQLYALRAEGEHAEMLSDEAIEAFRRAAEIRDALAEAGAQVRQHAQQLQEV